jgi:DNA-binding response OmpR family regulator
VLLVDDDKAFLATTSAVLAGRYDVQSAMTASGALRLLGARAFDALVVDWKLGQSDGIELVENVRRHYRSTALVMVTGEPDEFMAVVDRDVRKQVGVLPKPFEPEALFSRIDHAVRLAAMRSSVGVLRRR